MHTIWYILLTIPGISVLVITHELGHFFMGRALGFTITEFSVGLGPKLFGIKGKRTEFTLRALPIGGSCRFYGEDQEVQDERCFNSKPAWKRFLVVLAGPLVNILTCVLLCFVMLLAFGKTTEGTQFIRVSEFLEDSPAEEAGVEVGDILVSIDGTGFDDYQTFTKLIKSADSSGMELVVLRGATIEEHVQQEGLIKQTDTTVTGGTEMTLHLTRFGIDQKTGNRLIGIRPDVRTYSLKEEKFTVWKAAYMAFPETAELGGLVYKSLGMIITGQASFRDMSGILGTVDAVSDIVAEQSTASDAINVFVWFMALIAVNLGIINLFPLPALDGGRLIFIILEMIRKKPVPPEKEGLVHFIGMILLLLLIVALTISDLLRCFGR